MKKITHEGETYILQSDVETIIGDRVKKYAARAAAADESIRELQTRIDEQSKTSSDVNLLRDKIDSLQTQLAQSQSKFTRHVAINKHGINTPEVIELIEWSYDKTMKTKAKKDRVELGEWLQNIIEDPTNAPLTLRPHLPQQQQTQQQQNNDDEATSEIQSPSTIQPPSINRGAVNTPEDNNFSRMNDREYYRANREQIKKSWYQQFKRRG